MKVLAYSVNLEKLFNAQDAQLSRNEEKQRLKIKRGAENRERLLKIVLPFVHGVLALHNRKCSYDWNYSTGCDGLLGISKADIQRKIDHIVNTDHHLTWQGNFDTFVFKVGNKKIKIWLNDREGGAHRSGASRYLNLPYSMTSFGSDSYGTSVENELLLIAKYCSIFKDEWK